MATWMWNIYLFHLPLRYKDRDSSRFPETPKPEENWFYVDSPRKPSGQNEALTYLKPVQNVLLNEACALQGRSPWRREGNQNTALHKGGHKEAFQSGLCAGSSPPEMCHGYRGKQKIQAPVRNWNFSRLISVLHAENRTRRALPLETGTGQGSLVPRCCSKNSHPVEPGWQSQTTGSWPLVSYRTAFNQV